MCIRDRNVAASAGHGWSWGSNPCSRPRLHRRPETTGAPASAFTPPLQVRKRWSGQPPVQSRCCPPSTSNL
eukprot:676665-Lingulodinium_polyedra.AAC.1